jgi:hypothetical protein
MKAALFPLCSHFRSPQALAHPCARPLTGTRWIRQARPTDGAVVHPTLRTRRTLPSRRRKTRRFTFACIADGGSHAPEVDHAVAASATGFHQGTARSAGACRSSASMGKAARLLPRGTGRGYRRRRAWRWTICDRGVTARRQIIDDRLGQLIG